MHYKIIEDLVNDGPNPFINPPGRLLNLQGQLNNAISNFIEPAEENIMNLFE